MNTHDTPGTTSARDRLPPEVIKSFRERTSISTVTFDMGIADPAAFRSVERAAGVSRKQHRHPTKVSSKPAARMSPLLLVLAMRQFPEVASEHVRQAVEQQLQTLIAKNTQKAGA